MSSLALAQARSRSEASWMPSHVLIGLLIGAFAVAIALPTSPLLRGAGDDGEIFRYIGMLITRGGMPYLDAFENKPPLIFLIAALGHPFGYWGFWVIERLVIAAASIAFYYLLRARQVPWSPALALGFVAVLTFPPVYEQGGNPRIFAAAISLFAYIVLSGQARSRYLLAGIAAGLIYMLQQTETLPLLGWCAVVGLRERRIWLAAVSFVVGAALSTVPIIGWLAARGALAEYLYQSYTYNALYVVSAVPGPACITCLGPNETGPIARILRLLTRLWEVRLLVPVVASLGLAAAAGRRGLGSDLRIPALVALALECVNISLSGRFYGQYFSGLVPILFLLLAEGLRLNQDRLRQWRVLDWRVGLLVGLLLVAAVLGAVSSKIASKAALASRTSWRAEYDVINDPYRPYLEPLAGTSGQLMIMSSFGALHLHTAFGITSPTRWIYTVPWEEQPNFDAEGAIFGSILDDVERAKTAYVVDFSATVPLPAEVRERWDTFLRSHYQIVGVMPDGGTLWSRRS